MGLAAQRVISGPRLLLRTLTAAEAEQLLTSDYPAGVFARGYPSAFAHEVLRLVALYPATDHDFGAGVPNLGPWLVIRRTDEAIVGVMSCARTADTATVSVGYDIAPSCWGQGYATEALTTAVEHLLSLPEVWRVCAETRADHVASRRVLEKAGMHWARTELTEHEGRTVELVHYVIERYGLR